MGTSNWRKGLDYQFDTKWVPIGTCHVWIGAAGHRGNLWVSDLKKTKTASHVAWFLKHKEWPTMQMNHLCNNAMCVNPDHLYHGTQKQNMADLAATGYKNKGGNKIKGVPNKKNRKLK